MKYVIQKALIEDGEIVGYEVVDKTGSTKKLKLEDVIKLAEMGHTNCEVVLDNSNNKHLYFNTKTENIEDTEQMHVIECRIVNNGELLGYKVKTEDGKTRRLRPYKVWELAAKGKVENADGIVIGDKPTIVGKDKKLSDIPVLSM